WKVVLYGRTQDTVEARVIRLAVCLLRHHDPDTDRARCLLPVGDDRTEEPVPLVDVPGFIEARRRGPNEPRASRLPFWFRRRDWLSSETRCFERSRVSRDWASCRY